MSLKLKSDRGTVQNADGHTICLILVVNQRTNGRTQLWTVGFAFSFESFIAKLSNVNGSLLILKKTKNSPNNS
jgi:hypothetical protein